MGVPVIKTEKNKPIKCRLVALNESKTILFLSQMPIAIINL